MATTSKSKPKAAPVSSKQAIKSRREAEAKRRQQQQRILLAIGAVTVLAIVAIVILIQVQPIEAAISEDVKTAYEGYNTGRTADGYYFVGAENAPTTMEEFSSFSCSACKQYHDTIYASLKDKLKEGSLKFVYIPLTTYGSFLSEGMTRGAICAGEQGKFWEMHDILFDWQGRYGSNSNDYRRLTNAATALGLDAGKFNTCLSAESTKQLLDKAVAEAAKRGVSSTPNVFLNGQKIYPDMVGRTSPLEIGEIRGLIEANAKSQ